MSIGRKVFENFSDGASYSLESVKNGFEKTGHQIKMMWDKFMTGTNADEVMKQNMELAKANAEA